MKKELFNNALNHIDPSLVDEFVKEKEQLEKRRRHKRFITAISSAAACFVVVMILSIVVATMSDKKIPSSSDELDSAVHDFLDAIQSSQDSIHNWDEAASVLYEKIKELGDIKANYPDNEQIITLYAEAINDILAAKTIGEIDEIIQRFDEDAKSLTEKLPSQSE